MGQPAARQNDPVMGTDIHIVMVPSPGGPVPTPLPHPFSGTLTTGLSTDVLIDGLAAAVAGSTAQATAPHIPTPPGTAFQIPPMNQGTVQSGSATVMVNGRPAARMGDPVATCNDPAPAPVSSITGGSPTVMIG